MNTSRKILRFILRIIFFATVLALAFWLRTKYISNHTTAPSLKKVQEQIVALENPKETEFQWEYNGKNYKLSETFYASLYNFYANSPKTYSYQGEISTEWEKDYYAMFLTHTKSDDSISLLATDLQNLGTEKKLNPDQMVELTLAFVQAIPYDHLRAEQILSGSGVTNYPYETLFENKGVCSDKSFLLANLLSKMGYGTALLTYDDEQHMAVGIGCPAEFSSYDSGYCYAETTSSGFRIGMIPEIDSKEGSALPLEKKSYSQNSELSQFDAKKLGEPTIIWVSSGKTYAGIADSLALAKKIDALSREISTLEKNLLAQKNDFDADEANLLELEKKLKKLEKNGDYKEYNNQVEGYNSLLKKYKAKIKTYNEQINVYNQKINNYNSLVKGF